MQTRQIEKYRARLEQLGRRHEGELNGLLDEASRGVGGESGGSLSNTPHHQADLGTAHHSEEVNLLLMQNQERLLAECEAALARIAAGSYGVCQSCGQEIPTGRLDAFPYARYCVACAERIEQIEGQPAPAGDAWDQPDRQPPSDPSSAPESGTVRDDTTGSPPADRGGDNPNRADEER